MPVIAEAAGGTIWLQTDFRLKEDVKKIPGAAWSQEHKLWHLPLTWAGCKYVKGVFGADIQVGPVLGAWAADFYQRVVLPAMYLRTAVDVPGDPRLREDQRVAVEMMLLTRTTLVGDPTGFGKTVVTAAALQTAASRAALPSPYPALIAAPNGVKRGWLRELGIWAPDARVGLLTGSAPKRRKVIEQVAAGELDVLVSNWELLRYHSRLAPYGSVRLKACAKCDPSGLVSENVCERHQRELNLVPWATVVGDEMHRARDPKTKWTRALWQLGRTESVVYRWGLTGTPAEEAVDELWSLLNFMDHHAHPTKTKFTDRYALQTFNMFGQMNVVGLNPETRQEFYDIFYPFFLRRPKELLKLPPVVPILRTPEMDAKQRKLYNEIADEGLARLDNGDVLLASNPLSITVRLEQAASSCLDSMPCEKCAGTGVGPNTHEFTPHPQNPAYCACTEVAEAGVHKTKCQVCHGQGVVYFPIEPSNKIDDLLDVLAELEPEQQVVVFAVRRKFIELVAARLTKAGVAHVSITGAVSEAARAVNLRAFQNREARVCLVVVAAGGEGLDGLQCASVHVNLERHHSRIKNVQVDGRLVRSGQTESVRMIDIRTTGTIEDDKAMTQALKEDRYEELVRDQDQLRRLLGIRA